MKWGMWNRERWPTDDVIVKSRALDGLGWEGGKGELEGGQSSDEAVEGTQECPYQARLRR